MSFKAKAKAKAAKTAPYDYDMEIYDFSNPDHFHQIIRYWKRLDACGPFNLDFFPDSSVIIFGGIHPCFYDEYENYRAEVDKCVLHAIAYAKKENKMKLEDSKVVNANHQGHYGTMYYITFDAKEKRSGKRQLYDAKVLFGFNEFRGKHGIDVRLIRVKSSQKKSRVTCWSHSVAGAIEARKNSQVREGYKVVQIVN